MYKILSKSFLPLYFCLRSKPVTPNVVCQCVSQSVAMLNKTMTWWPDLVMTWWQMTWWPDELMTQWPNVLMTQWPNDKMTLWSDDLIAWWPNCLVTWWLKASHTIDRMVYFLFCILLVATNASTHHFLNVQQTESWLCAPNPIWPHGIDS